MPTFGKPAMVSWNGDRLDVFLKSKSRTLIHTWLQDGVDGAMDLGGDLDSDPVAVARGDQVLDVFARSRDQRLLHWQWAPERGEMVERLPLPGFIVSNPVAVVSGPHKLFVFARSLDGPLRIWESSRDEFAAESWSFPRTRGDFVTADPVVVQRMDKLSVFVRGNDHGLEYWRFDDGDLLESIRLGGSLVSAPAAVCSEDSRGFLRLDVYGTDRERRLWHWGRAFLSSSAPHGWFGPESAPGIAETFPFDPIAVSDGPEEINLFARGADSTLRHWSWDAGNRTWIGPEVLGNGLASDPRAISRSPNLLDVVAQTKEDMLLLWSWNGQTWTPRPWPLRMVVPEPPEDTIAGVIDDLAPDYLVTRSADHVMIGLRTPGYRLIDEQPPKLVALNGNAHLVVTFPPQHIAEEVSKPGGTPIVPIPGQGHVWQARLSGPSRVAFEVRPESAIELTCEGILAALNGAKVSPNEDRSAIELPFGLIVSPQAPESGEPVVTRHPAQPVDFSGNVGLWRTRFGTAQGDGGLAVKGVRAGRPDPFPVALTKANRLFVSQQSTPASAERLELSSLGGSLTASGKWRSFEWDHHIVLGRDQVVRTVTKGVLYPLGHKAVFVEMTERSSREPIAVLRETQTLYLTEARRGQPSAPAPLKHAFPFSEVELTRLEYRDLDNADWQTIPRPSRDIAVLEQYLASFHARMRDLHAELHGEMGFHGGPVTEDLAVLGQDAEIRERASEYLRVHGDADRTQRAIAALRRDGQAIDNQETYFLPTTNGKEVRFPVRGRAANRDVDFDLPLLFVADLELRDDVREDFISLSDPRVAESLRKFYGDRGSVALPGVPINTTSSDGASASPSDVHEVHRLNIVGNGAGVGFRPSLGRPDDPTSWGAEIALPAMRTLLGRNPQVRVNFAPEYLATGTGDLAIKVLGEVVPGLDSLKPLDVDFTTSTDRSGGLAAPKFVADGISRGRGLINVAGVQTFLPGTEFLDPKTLFSSEASLFGFKLRDLVGDIKVPPEFVTILTEGEPPTVRMTWNDVALTPSPPEHPIFVPLPEPPPGTEGPTSRLTLSVVSSPTLNESTCAITNFTLAMPPGEDRLIEITFGKVEFRQTTGKPPTLTLEQLSARLVGKLRLLQTLQEKVGLGDMAPKIQTSSSEIVASFAIPVPDVAAFSFVMSNLAFNADLRVPFNGEPVSLALGFASRARPFTLTVLMFGGGGYVDLEVIHTGLRRLEVSLQFGAAIAINFGIGTAEVHAFGGIRYALQPNNSVVLTGFIHIGGSVELLGLISVSVELRVELDYQFDSNRLVGRAKLVIEIDITLYSESVELDSGEWAIAGGSPTVRRIPVVPPIASLAGVPANLEEAAIQAWRDYREAFT